MKKHIGVPNKLLPKSPKRSVDVVPFSAHGRKNIMDKVDLGFKKLRLIGITTQLTSFRTSAQLENARVARSTESR